MKHNCSTRRVAQTPGIAGQCLGRFISELFIECFRGHFAERRRHETDRPKREPTIARHIVLLGDKINADILITVRRPTHCIAYLYESPASVSAVVAVWAPPRLPTAQENTRRTFGAFDGQSVILETTDGTLPPFQHLKQTLSFTDLSRQYQQAVTIDAQQNTRHKECCSSEHHQHGDVEQLFRPVDQYHE